MYKEIQKHKTVLSNIYIYLHSKNFFLFLILTYQGKQHKNSVYTGSRFFSNKIKSVNRIIKRFNMDADSALSAAICKYALSCIKPGYFFYLCLFTVLSDTRYIMRICLCCLTPDKKLLLLC